MKVLIDIKKIRKNISKAEDIARRSISLMFKEFYEDIYFHIGNIENKIFSKNIPQSVCYSLRNANPLHKGCFIISFDEFLNNYKRNRIREFYIPINAKDNREGLSTRSALELCKLIKAYDDKVKLIGSVTSGCLNENYPIRSELNELWRNVRGLIDSISIGGSFWLAKNNIPNFVSDIRIGEYMIFGTIPYDFNQLLRGENSIEIKAKIIGVYPERKQVIIDCGYTIADVNNCSIQDDNLKYVDSSSEYTILEVTNGIYSLNEEITIVPNYKSLVKLKDAERYYI